MKHTKEELIAKYNQLFQQAESTKDTNDRTHLFDMAQNIAFQINDIEQNELEKKTREQYNDDCIARIAVIVALRENCLFISDVAAFMPISRASMYNRNLDKLDALKAIIRYNKINTKHSMRAKWYKSEAPSLQIALYKLIAESEELQRLTMNNVNIDEGLFDSMDKEELEQALYSKDDDTEKFDFSEDSEHE